MAKSKTTPLRDEPVTSFDDVCAKLDELINVINRQNNYLKEIAKKNALDSEYNSVINECMITNTISEGIVKYLRERNAKISMDGDENDTLTRAMKALEEFVTIIQPIKDAISKGELSVTHAAPSENKKKTTTPTIERRKEPKTYKEILIYLFCLLPWYHIRQFFTSPYFKRWLIIIMLCIWVGSITFTCIIAMDNARMHQVYRAIYMHSGIK